MAPLYISMVSVALQYMPPAFKGQKDKTGREMQFLHSLRVYDLVKKSSQACEIAETAALLHDVIEDTDQTVDDLRRVFAAYPTEKVEKMIAIVLAVTRGYIRRADGVMVFSPPSPALVCDCRSAKSFKCVNTAHEYDKETYRDFVMRSKRHPLGRVVKIADITENSTPERTAGLSEAEKGIVEERYVPALAFLKDNKATEFFMPRQLERKCQFCLRPFSEHLGTPERFCSRESMLAQPVIKTCVLVDPPRTTYKGVK